MADGMVTADRTYTETASEALTEPILVAKKAATEIGIALTSI